MAILFSWHHPLRRCSFGPIGEEVEVQRRVVLRRRRKGGLTGRPEPSPTTPPRHHKPHFTDIPAPSRHIITTNGLSHFNDDGKAKKSGKGREGAGRRRRGERGERRGLMTTEVSLQQHNIPHPQSLIITNKTPNINAPICRTHLVSLFAGDEGNGEGVVGNGRFEMIVN